MSTNKAQASTVSEKSSSSIAGQSEQNLFSNQKSVPINLPESEAEEALCTASLV